MNYKTIAFWVMILTIIGLCAYLYTYTSSESFKCMASPLTYGADHIGSGTERLHCTCGVKGVAGSIYFDNKNLTMTYDSVPPLEFQNVFAQSLLNSS